MSQFDELLAQLNAAQEEQETMAKAIPQGDGEDDKAIQAAADEGADADDEKNPEDVEGDDDDKPMTKSIKIGDEDVLVVDAEAMIKSLGALDGRMTKSEENLAKAVSSMLGLVKGQSALIKSLQDKVAKLSTSGAGRKAVLSVHEKPDAAQPLAKSHQEGGMTPGEFLAKSNAAFEAKKITGKELTTIDVAIRSGQAHVLDEALVTRVLS